MNIRQYFYRWLGLGLASLVGLSAVAARSEQYPQVLTMTIAPLATSPEGRCPKTVTLNEISEPYEGGYNVKGWANLRTIAGNFTLANRDEFSTTWVADLKSEFKTCKASASGRYGSDLNATEATHLRLRFIGGKVYLILDMTGSQDANGYTPSIVSRGVRNGNPFWQWAGTD